MNYYQHHIGDFIRDTSRLNDTQCMAYLRMIWMYYETEQPLENDIDALAFKIGANASDVHQLLKHFFFEHEGRWHHSRCDKEILGFRNKSTKAKKSADTRWKNANSMRTQCERNANASEESANAPISDANQEPITSISKPSGLDIVCAKAPAPSENPSIESPKSTKSAKRAQRATALPDDFTPNQTHERIAVETRLNLQAEFEQFCDYHRGKGSRFADWDAALRTWLRNAVKFDPARKATARTAAETFRERDERLARERVAAFAPGVAAKPPVMETGMVIDAQPVLRRIGA